MNRIETMKAAAEDSSHRWWKTYTSPVDLRDLLAVIDAVREVRLAYLEDVADWKRIARAQLDLRNALARLDSS